MTDQYFELIPIEDEQWKLQANCTGTDDEAWHKDNGEYDYTMLNRICADCPVKAECYNYALTYDMLGYWAGTTAAQRRRVRRQKEKV
jgi:WhiB family redox-sensing transcriptional regulator